MHDSLETKRAKKTKKALKYKSVAGYTAPQVPREERAKHDMSKWTVEVEVSHTLNSESSTDSCTK